MSFAVRPVRLTCHRGELTEYAAGRLSGERMAAWDLHLVACASCRALLAEERRLTAALSGAPSLPGSLRGSLLALAAAPLSVPRAGRPSRPPPGSPR